VKACPKILIELRKKNAAKTPVAKRVWVQCTNKDKGPVANKVCKNSCIGCGKCVKACKFEAITLENNLAWIDSNKCKACGMCVSECPKGAIHATEPVMVVVEKLKAKKEAEKKAAAEAAAAAKAAEAETAKAAPLPQQEAPKAAEQ